MIHLAILGYGVVGSGVAEVCAMNREVIRKRCGQDVEIKYVLDIRSFPGDPLEDKVTSDPQVIFSDDAVSVVVETIGGVGIAFELTRKALAAGKHVVTSNKELVATHGPKLMQLARENKVNYLFEASVGGGIPIIRPLHRCLAANVLTKVAGILNGTTNYVLTRMANEPIDFADALAEAQAKGYAEQDPSADIDGIDACRKIAILSSIALGRYIDSRKIHCEGIRDIDTQDMLYAQDLGCKIKLLGLFKNEGSGKIDLIVAPMLVPCDHPLGMADDVFNAIMVEGNALGEAMFYGRGAGKLPTASAVVADVIECVMQDDLVHYMTPWQPEDPDQVLDHKNCPVRVLLRVDASIAATEIEAALAAWGVQWLDSHRQGERALLVGEKAIMTEGQLSEQLQPFADKVISRIRIF